MNTRAFRLFENFAGVVEACLFSACLSFAAVQSVHAASQLPDFTYQGQLQQNGQPANGNFNLTFALFNAANAGSQIGATIAENSFPVTGGLFTVSLSFPGAFTGTQLWLAVTVNGVAMSPRTAVATAPVAQYALSGSVSPTGPAGGNLAGNYPNPTIANGAVMLARMAETTKTGNINLSMGANACGTLALSLGGAQVGDLAVLGLGSGATPPANIVFGPVVITGAGAGSVRACNQAASSVSISDLPVIMRMFR
jgi:hypothetical protein